MDKIIVILATLIAGTVIWLMTGSIETESTQRDSSLQMFTRPFVLHEVLKELER